MAQKNINGDVNVEFTENTSRISLVSGESIKSSLGKIKKWLSDLKTVAFTGSYNDLTNKPSIPTNTDYRVQNVLNTDTKAYLTGTTSSSDSIGTQVFDTNVYLDSESGKLNADTLEIGGIKVTANDKYLNPEVLFYRTVSGINVMGGIYLTNDTLPGINFAFKSSEDDTLEYKTIKITPNELIPRISKYYALGNENNIFGKLFVADIAVSSSLWTPLTLHRDNAEYGSGIKVTNSNGTLGKFGFNKNGAFLVETGDSTDGTGNMLKISADSKVTASEFIGNLNGNASTATSADTAETASSADSVNSQFTNVTSATWYALPYLSGGSSDTGGNRAIANNANYRLINQSGTASSSGMTVLLLGSNTDSNAGNNAYGVCRLYGVNTYYAQIKADELTASRTLLLPDKAGTLATIDDIPSTSGFVDTSSNQTISGTKTFSNTISANVSGTASGLSSTLGVSQGGTGKTSAVQGGIMYGSSSSAMGWTSAGTSGYLLKSNGTSAPSWVNPSTLSVSYASSAGSATSATKATQDSSGNTITSTYIKNTGTETIGGYKNFTNSITTGGTINNGRCKPSSTNTYECGQSSAKWSACYATTFKGTMADYAEYFEWADGNNSNADRRGLFVTISSGEKISLADDTNDILGIVSATPLMVGEDVSDEWQGKYLKDIFGCYIYDEYNEKVLNPNYDESMEYVPRSERSEWDMVGLLGKLIMIDDGSCQVGWYCKPCSDGSGRATYSIEVTRCKVMKRIDETHIKVLFH